MSKKFNPRDLWLPKLPELKDQCVSCPFRKGNDKEFAEILVKLSLKHGRNPDVTPETPPEALRAAIEFSRKLVEHDVQKVGDFACHHTAYDENMNIKPVREHRQCPGATKYYRSLTA